MSVSVLDGATRRHQGLAQHLPPEHALGPPLRTAPAKQVEIEVLEIQQREQGVEGRLHVPPPSASPECAADSPGDDTLQMGEPP